MRVDGCGTEERPALDRSRAAGARTAGTENKHFGERLILLPEHGSHAGWPSEASRNKEADMTSNAMTVTIDSAIELAHLGEGTVAYVREMASDDLKGKFPGLPEIAAGHSAVGAVCRQRPADPAVRRARPGDCRRLRKRPDAVASTELDAQKWCRRPHRLHGRPEAAPRKQMPRTTRIRRSQKGHNARDKPVRSCPDSQAACEVGVSDSSA